MKRVEIAGGIASGKSSLVESFPLGKAGSIFERFTENPFFELFYANPARYAFETEITYMLQHYSSIFDAMSGECSPVVADFSMVLDLAYARVTLTAEDLVVFETVLDRALSKIGEPDLLVKLDCTPEVELARIRQRARAAELAITLDYLFKLNESVERVLKDRRFEGLKVLRIDSEKLDFRPEGGSRDAVISQVLAAINS